MLRFSLIFPLIFVASIPTNALAIDIIPGQVIAPRPGINAFMMTVNHTETGARYKNGRNLNLGTKVTTTVLQPRYTRSFSLFEKPAAFYLQPSFVNIQPRGSLSSVDQKTGWGDTAAVMAFWPYLNRKKGQYLGLAAYLIAPTSSYDSAQLINLGQNRFSAAFQIGYHFSLSEKTDAMVVGDIQWFEKNDDYRLTYQTYRQAPIYSLQTTLMYDISSSIILAGSYFYNTGGQGELDGIDQNDEINKHRYQVALIKNSKLGKFIFQYGSDLDTRDGFKEEKRAFFRYQYAWR